MLGLRTDVADALEGLSRATRALADGAPLEPVLSELVRAVAVGTGAEIAAVWLPDRDGALVVRAVTAASGAIGAEIEGLRAGNREGATEVMRRRLDPEAAMLSVPLDVDGGNGMLGLLRQGAEFEEDALGVAALAADVITLASRLRRDGHSAEDDGSRLLVIAGDALAAVAGEEVDGARVARLAAVAAGADGALIWRLRGSELELDDAYGALVPDPALEAAARAIVDDRRTIEVGRGGDGDTVTLQLGEPPLGALQLLFRPGRCPHEADLERLASFAVRAAHALRTAERAREAGFELERSRALLAVVGEAIAHLSLSHTLDIAIARVADLLGTDRVAVYLREDGRTVAAATRGIEGPHEAVADRLLVAALASRQGGIVEVDDAAADERLAPVRAQAQESGIRRALALPLVVGDHPIGLLAVYPLRRRPLTPNEGALLVALAAQLAVVVENARLHERQKELASSLTRALASEQEKAKRLQAQHEISRSFAHSLSLQTTLDQLAESIVDLLDVDAAVIRMPDERGAELVARSIHVNDERVDMAARALLSRPQQLLPHELRALFERSEPMLLDAARAESLGGALGLLAPFLRKGSSAALVPIATPAELVALLTIVSLNPSRPIAGEIAETALAIAGQAALAIENARLYNQQKAFADTMQRSLLPRAAPQLPGLELGDVYESAARVEVGGDVYDYLTLDDGRLAVVLGDVTGHGIDATADMAMAKFVFRSLAREHVVPGQFLAAANDVVSSEIAPGRFITMVELVIDAERGEVACASGGHPQPRLVLPDGSVRGIPAGGLALGIDAPQAYETVTVDFPPGAIVVAYTDGVTEARRGGRQFGVRKLDALLAGGRRLSPRAIAEAALGACRDWTDGELTDDCAVVVIKRSESA